MAAIQRSLVVALVVAGTALAGCGGDDGEDSDTAGLTVCQVEERSKGVMDVTDFSDFPKAAEQAVDAMDDLLALRHAGDPPAEIEAEYDDVTEAYQILRDAFDGATSPEDFARTVEPAAADEFGDEAEVDRFQDAYEAWVEDECGIALNLGISLFSDEI